MLGLFGRKRREAELFSMMMKATAEGHRRGLVNRAAGTIGATFQSEADNTEYCINAVAAIVPVVMRQAGCAVDKLSKADVFNGSLFAFAYSSHLCTFIGAEFEIAAATALIPLFGRQLNDDELCNLPAAVIDIYNQFCSAGDTISTIGGRFAEWMNDPTDQNFQSVVDSYRHFHAATTKHAWPPR